MKKFCFIHFSIGFVNISIEALIEEMIMRHVGTNNTLPLVQNHHAQIFSRYSIGRIEWAVRRLQFIIHHI